VKQRVLLILTGFIGLLFNLNVFIRPIGTLPQEKIAVETQIFLFHLNWVNAANLSSGSIRLFGNGGGMSTENNNISRPDDLGGECDTGSSGGDGVLSGTDYILFFSNGVDRWIKDSITKDSLIRKNLYSDKAYYYLIVGGNGKRIGGEGECR